MAAAAVLLLWAWILLLLLLPTDRSPWSVAGACCRRELESHHIFELSFFVVVPCLGGMLMSNVKKHDSVMACSEKGCS